MPIDIMRTERMAKLYKENFLMYEPIFFGSFFEYSLIREYSKNEPKKIGSYIKKFSLYNFAILSVLIMSMGIILGF